jgi:tetratricopeptide (TPR) repeat protein
VAPARPALPETDVGASAAPAVVSLRWERRLITVFGAVLAGPDDDASPLPFAAALGQLIAKLRTFGARIEEVTPNRIVAVFGFEPTEDGPRRAAHAALAMLKALDRMEGGPGPPLTGRFAIHVCRCLIAQAGDVAGMDDADRRAAWSALDALIGRARPQSVLVGAAGARFLERRFTLEPAEDIAGAHEAAYRVVGHERRGFEVGGVALSRFVGRARDLAVLHEYLRRVEDGRGQVVGILGEPGVGKSRLLHEFRESLDPGRVRHIEGRCLSYGSTIPYLPIIDIVRTSFGVLESDAADVTADKVRAGLQAMGLDVEVSAPYLLHLLGAREGAEAVSRLEPDAVKARTMSVLRQMGVAGSRERPVILAVEDLQWIDPTSEEVLASLSEGLASYPLMLIATYRPGYRPPWLGRSYASQIALGRLTPGDSLAVVHSVASERELAPGLAQMIVTHADGVPFFLEELARAVTEHADLRTGVTVPDTIQGVLEARLDRLPAGEKLLLQTASVIGKDVPMPLLQSVADIPEADLRTSLAHLQAAEFIHLRQVSPAEEYTFKHALTHEAAYGSMLEAPRRQLHARVAEALERLHPDARERQPELLARHYTSAGLRPQAVACWQLAGQRAIRRSASAEAIAHLRSGLGLLAGLPDARARAPQELMLRLALGQAQVMAHGYGAPDVGETLARAHELSRQVGDSHQAFPLLFGLWRFYLARADLPAALGLAEQLLAVARRQGDPMLLTAGNIAVAVPRFYRGELAAARAHLEQAYATYRPEHTAPQAVAYGQDLGVGALAFLGWTLGLLGYRDQGLATSERAVALARTAAHPFSLALALLLAGWVRHLRGEVEAMGQLGEEELALSREQAFPFFLAGGFDLTGAALVARGETDAGLARMREGARIYRAAGVEVGLVHLAHLAEVLVDTGHVDEALAVVADALGRAPASGEGVYRAELYRIKGLALSRRDDREGAAACFRDAIALARQQEARVFELRAATSLAEIDLQGSSPALDAGLAACSAWFTEGLDLADQRAARALLSARSARPSPA